MTGFRRWLVVVPTCHVVFPYPVCEEKTEEKLRLFLCTKVKDVKVRRLKTHTSRHTAGMVVTGIPYKEKSA